MNARKALLVLAGIGGAVLAALLAVALFTIRKMETEKNRAKTQKARENRWKQNEAATNAALDNDLKDTGVSMPPEEQTDDRKDETEQTD